MKIQEIKNQNQIQIQTPAIEASVIEAQSIGYSIPPFDKIQQAQKIQAKNVQKKQKGVVKLTLIVILISLSSFYYGFVLTYMSTIPKSTLVKFYGDIINQPSTLPFISGAMPVGAIFGSLLANIVMRFFTRRNFLIFVNIIAIGVNIVIQITNIYVLLICRLITGVLVGLYLGIVPTYINQITPKNLLGTMGSFTQMQHLFGNVISYLFGMIFYLCNYQGDFMMRFQFQFTSVLILAQILGIGFGFIPESPNSLLMKGQYEQARIVLEMFNQEDQISRIIDEKLFQNGQKKIKLNNQANQQSLLQPDQQIQSIQQGSPDPPNIQKNSQKQLQNNNEIEMNWRSYFLSFELPLTQQLTGVNFIVTQVTQVTALYDQPLSHFTGLIANFIQFVSTAFSAYLLAKVGRRTIIVVGTISVGLLTIVIGIVFLELDKGWKAGFALGMALIMVFNVIYGLTLGPVVWLYVPEIAKKKIVPVATATYWGGCSFSLIVAPIITTIMHSPYAVFLFFGAYTSAMILPNYFLVEQTKGFTPTQINKKFKKI